MWEGMIGGKGRRDFRNRYKGHMDITKVGCGIRGGRWGWLGSGGVVWGKCRQLYLNNNKILKKKNKKVDYVVEF